MARNLFSVPIYFIVFRETVEAAIIVSVLLGMVEQIVHNDHGHDLTDAELTAASDSLNDEKKPDNDAEQPVVAQIQSEASEEDAHMSDRRLVRKMRIQIFVGAALGLFIAFAIGAAFIAVWFTQATDLWSKSEALWQGIFQLIASILIFVMGITMLKMDRAKLKWRVKLQRAFAGKHVDGRSRAGKYMLFILPFITVLREAIEAVVFVGGVSLSESATSIPIPAIVALISGLGVGCLVYAFASRTTLTIFMVVMTNLVLLIGAGLFSQCVYRFESYEFGRLVGAQVDDTRGDGPGSFDVRGSVWHIDCCNPMNNYDNGGWMIFNAILGWTNSASVGTVLAYVFYWLTVIAALVYTKFKEGRTTLFGRESAAAVRRRERAAEREHLARQEPPQEIS